MEGLTQTQYNNAKQWHNDHFAYVRIITELVTQESRLAVPPCKGHAKKRKAFQTYGNLAVGDGS